MYTSCKEEEMTLILDSTNMTQVCINKSSTSVFVLSPKRLEEYSVLAVMLVTLAIVGIVGNIPVLIVYCRRRENMMCNTFIKVLALLDLFVCMLILPYTIVYEYHLVTSDIVCRLFEFLRHFTVLSSGLTLVAIAVERYIAVCQIGTKLNVNSIKTGIWVIFAVSAIVSSPSVGIFAVVPESDVKDVECHFAHELTSGTFCHFTYGIMGKVLVTAYQTLQCVVFFITVLIITVLYSIVYIVLWNKSKLRRKMINRSIVLQDSEISYIEKNRHGQNGRTREPTSRCSSSPKISAVDANKSNDDVLEQELTVNSIELQNVSTPAQTSTDSENQIQTIPNSPPASVRPKRIKFSVSAQSGRSEKLKRKRLYHRRTAKMLFLCTVIFIMTWLPFWIDIFGITDSLILRYLFFIGHASNPIVYGIVNAQVRREFKRLFCECLRKWFKYRNDSDQKEDSLSLSVTTRHETEA